MRRFPNLATSPSFLRFISRPTCLLLKDHRSIFVRFPFAAPLAGREMGRIKDENLIHPSCDVRGPQAGRLTDKVNGPVASRMARRPRSRMIIDREARLVEWANGGRL